MKKGCCNDVKVAFKKSSFDQKTVHPSLVLQSEAILACTTVFSAGDNFKPVTPRKIIPSVHAPPQELLVSTYLRNCVFII